MGIIISLVQLSSNTCDEFGTFQTSRIHVATNNRYIQRFDVPAHAQMVSWNLDIHECSCLLVVIIMKILNL